MKNLVVFTFSFIVPFAIQKSHSFFTQDFKKAVILKMCICLLLFFIFCIM